DAAAKQAAAVGPEIRSSALVMSRTDRATPTELETFSLTGEVKSGDTASAASAISFGPGMWKHADNWRLNLSRPSFVLGFEVHPGGRSESVSTARRAIASSAGSVVGDDGVAGDDVVVPARPVDGDVPPLELPPF